MKSKKNLILITIDSLRADHLHCMGYPKNITPNIDRLSTQGALFTNAIANAPYTSESVPSFITSSLPPFKERPAKTIAQILKENGFKTAAFNPNPMFLIYNNHNYTRGFGHYDMMLHKNKKTKKKLRERFKILFLRLGVYEETVLARLLQFLKEKSNRHQIASFCHKICFKILDMMLKNRPFLFFSEGNVYSPSAKTINAKIIDWVKNNKESSFFLWIHYMDVHSPYLNEGSMDNKYDLYVLAKFQYFPDLLTKKEMEKIVDLYNGKIKYVDREIGNLLQNMKKAGIEDNIVIISADHGDAFGEHGSFGHGSFFKNGKFRTNVYDELLKVPLIISGTGKRSVVTEQVELMDLGPTICELLNIPTPVCFFGENMFSKKQKGVVSYSRDALSYRIKKYKLIINKSENEKNELYDLMLDPEEKKDIYLKNQKVAKSMKLEMLKTLKGFNNKKKLLNVKKIFLSNQTDKT